MTEPRVPRTPAEITASEGSEAQDRGAGLTGAGMEGMGTRLRSTLPILELLQSFLQDAAGTKDTW